MKYGLHNHAHEDIIETKRVEACDCNLKQKVYTLFCSGHVTFIENNEHVRNQLLNMNKSQLNYALRRKFKRHAA